MFDYQLDYFLSSNWQLYIKIEKYQEIIKYFNVIQMFLDNKVKELYL